MAKMANRRPYKWDPTTGLPKITPPPQGFPCPCAPRADPPGHTSQMTFSGRWEVVGLIIQWGWSQTGHGDCRDAFSCPTVGSRGAYLPGQRPVPSQPPPGLGRGYHWPPLQWLLGGGGPFCFPVHRSRKPCHGCLKHRGQLPPPPHHQTWPPKMAHFCKNVGQISSFSP